MRAVSVQTQEDKRGRIGQGNIDGIPLSRTATVDLMAQTPYLIEEHPTKKHPAQHIGHGIA